MPHKITSRERRILLQMERLSGVRNASKPENRVVTFAMRNKDLFSLCLDERKSMLELFLLFFLFRVVMYFLRSSYSVFVQNSSHLFVSTSPPFSRKLSGHFSFH